MDRGIETERVVMHVPGEQAEPAEHQTMGGYLARPRAPGKHPGVLLFMEIFGINPHIRDVTERIAREGYVVLALDFFHRTAPGIELPYDQHGHDAGMPLLQKLERPEAVRDIRAALSYLRGRPEVTADRIGAIGFCVGGHMAFLAATQFDLRATASFYGGGLAHAQIKLSQPEATVDLAPGIKKHGGKLLAFFGGQDAWIPPADVRRVEQALKDADVPHEVVVYDKAGHAFFRDVGETFHAPSRDDAWQRVKRFFNEELKTN